MRTIGRTGTSRVVMPGSGAAPGSGKVTAMRKHVDGDGPAPRPGGTALMRITTVTLLAMCLIGSGVGCGDNDDDHADGDPVPRADGAILALAPPHAVGVIHVGKWGRTLAMLNENLGLLKGTPAGEPIRLMLPFVRGITSVDVFLAPVPGKAEIDGIVALRGTFGPTDMTKLLNVMIPGEMKIDKPGNGRYLFSDANARSPFVMIIGDEANDVPAGVVLIGQGPMMTDKTVAGLGKSDNAALKRMLAGVDTTADICGAVQLDASQKDLPAEISGSIYLTGPNAVKLTLVCRSEQMARQMMALAGNKFMAKVVNATRDGMTVRMTCTASMDTMLIIVTQMWKDMSKWADDLWDKAKAREGADPADLE